MTISALLTALVLGAATIAACIRLALWRRAAGSTIGAPWRFVTLLLLQPLCALALYLTLFPPPTQQPAGTLRIATAGTPRSIALASGPPLIALPEAGRISGAQAVPDLATALRRYPGKNRIIILGEGLPPRDIDAARNIALSFTPPAPRSGILALTPPPTVAPGASFSVSGQIAGRSGSVELLDPAGRLTDRSVPDAKGFFQLQGTARTAGRTVFTLRVKHGSRIIEHAQIPVAVADPIKTRLLIVAAAPSAEVKYLRRWASDAGMDVVAQMQTGAGVALGDPAISIDPSALSRFDAVVFDDRSWAALGNRRSIVLGAVANGLGLILHPSGAIDTNVRAQWQSLGFALKGGNALAPLNLPPVADAAVEATRFGIGSKDQPIDAALPNDPLPDLSRLTATPGGSDAAPLLRDGGGSVIAAWLASGTGRIALFTPIDSYGLTLAGRRALYENWWSDLFSTVLRPAASPVAFRQIYWAGERATLCGIPPTATVRAPDGKVSQILAEGSCGGYWPTSSGWHQVETGGQLRAFFVQPADALPAMRSARDTSATQLIVTHGKRSTESSREHPMPSWPFAILWLIISAILWWLERSYLGKATPPQSAM